MSQELGLFVFVVMYGFALGEYLVQRIQRFFRSKDAETEAPTIESSANLTPLMNETIDRHRFREQ